jgi:hypothetical protein
MILYVDMYLRLSYIVDKVYSINKQIEYSISQIAIVIYFIYKVKRALYVILINDIFAAGE